MCAEFSQDKPFRDIARYFGIEGVPQLRPRANLFPGMPIAVVGRKPNTTERGLIQIRWGLVPRWYNDPSQKPQPHNARAESVEKLPEFRELFHGQRCLVPATAFYEWGTTAGRKKKYRFRFKDDRPFAFAGLWDLWVGGPTEKLLSCCFITGQPNGVVAEVHDRMPVILDPGDYEAWLDPATPVERLRALLEPCPGEEMECLPV